MCLPSRSESFGLVYIEALACGTPVVGFGPTLAEIERATGRSCGVPLDDISGPTIAAGLRRVLDQPWDHAGLREATLRVFGIDRAAARYAAVLAEAASVR
jgi:glycosyltransferase involved in cell wall biosynthesis